MTAAARANVSLVSSTPPPAGKFRRHTRRIRGTWSAANDKAKKTAVAALLAAKTTKALTDDDYAYQGKLVDRDPRTVKRWVQQAEEQLRAAPDDIVAAQLTAALFDGESAQPEFPLTRATVVAQDGDTIFHWPRGCRFEITPDMYSIVAGRPLWDSFVTDIAPRLCRPMSYPTFTRAFSRLPEETRKGLLGGEKAALDARIYFPQERGQLNDTWSIDLMFPNVRTAHADGVRVHRPCWASIRDEATGVYLAWKLWSRSPTTSDIIALFRRAIIGRHLADGTFLGGVPRRVRCDQGTQFGLLLAEAGLHVGFTVDPTNNHSSWENGKQERSHQVVRRTALDDLPGRTNGPRDRTGQPYFKDSDDVLAFDELGAILDRYARSETEDAGATRTRGVAPAELAVQHQNAPGWVSRIADARDLAWLSDYVGVYTRRKSGGIEMGGVTYLLDLLYDSDEPGSASSSRKFAIRTIPDDPDVIEVFTEDGGTWLGTATRADAATAEQMTKVLVGRNRRKRDYNSAVKEGEERKRIRHGDKMVTPLGPVPKNDADMAEPAVDAPAEPTPDPDVEPDAVPDDLAQTPATEPGQPVDGLTARLQARRAASTAEMTP